MVFLKKLFNKRIAELQEKLNITAITKQKLETLYLTKILNEDLIKIICFGEFFNTKEWTLIGNRSIFNPLFMLNINFKEIGLIPVFEKDKSTTDKKSFICFDTSNGKWYNCKFIWINPVETSCENKEEIDIKILVDDELLNNLSIKYNQAKERIMNILINSNSTKIFRNLLGSYFKTGVIKYNNKIMPAFPILGGEISDEEYQEIGEKIFLKVFNIFINYIKNISGNGEIKLDGKANYFFKYDFL